MSRRINYTGRRKLTRESFRIKLIEGKNGSPPSFSADVSIPSEAKLEPQARVYIEAYVGTSSMRFDFGTVASVAPPSECVLTDVDANTPVLFRVRIVDESSNIGRILAAANGIRPEGDRDGKNRKSLLPLRAMDLGEELWRLDVDKDAGPTLAVNNKVPGFSERLPSDPLLMGLIYPEIVRQMVHHLFGAPDGFDETVDWVQDWRSWLSQQLGREITAEDCIDLDSRDVMADDVARYFSDRNRFASKVAQAVGGGW